MTIPDALVAVVRQAVAELDAEHYLDLELKVEVTFPGRHRAHERHERRSEVKITAEQCDEIIETVERIRGDLPTLYELDRRLGLVERPDGFRTSVRPMEGSRTSTDEDGNPIPSDPTGESVVAMLSGDGRRSSVREDVQLLNACLAEIRGLVRQADGARGRAMLPDGRTLDPEQCDVHLRHGQGFAAVHRSARCRWCYDFWLAEGVDAPADLLIAYGQGRRITQPMVAEALRHQPKAKSKRRRAG